VVAPLLLVHCHRPKRVPDYRVTLLPWQWLPFVAQFILTPAAYGSERLEGYSAPPSLILGSALLPRGVGEYNLMGLGLPATPCPGGNGGLLAWLWLKP